MLLHHTRVFYSFLLIHCGGMVAASDAVLCRESMDYAGVRNAIPVVGSGVSKEVIDHPESGEVNAAGTAAEDGKFAEAEGTEQEGNLFEYSTEQVKISLELSRKQYVSGEEIILKTTMTNIGSEVIYYWWTSTCEEFKVSVANQDTGENLELTTRGKGMFFPIIRSQFITSLSSDSAFSDTINLTRAFDLSRPATYLLEIEMSYMDHTDARNTIPVVVSGLSWEVVDHPESGETGATGTAVEDGKLNEARQVEGEVDPLWYLVK